VKSRQPVCHSEIKCNLFSSVRSRLQCAKNPWEQSKAWVTATEANCEEEKQPTLICSDHPHALAGPVLFPYAALRRNVFPTRQGQFPTGSYCFAITAAIATGQAEALLGLSMFQGRQAHCDVTAKAFPISPTP
jgi:hypothetical protein